MEFVFPRTDYPHVKHRKCRSRFVSVKICGSLLDGNGEANPRAFGKAVQLVIATLTVVDKFQSHIVPDSIWMAVMPILVGEGVCFSTSFVHGSGDVVRVSLDVVGRAEPVVDPVPIVDELAAWRSPLQRASIATCD
jgi:hypothetical protein